LFVNQKRQSVRLILLGIKIFNIRFLLPLMLIWFIWHLVFLESCALGNLLLSVYFKLLHLVRREFIILRAFIA